MKRRLLNILLIIVMMLSLSPAALAQVGGGPVTNRTVPDSVAGLRLSSPLTVSNVNLQSKLNQALTGAQGPQRVVIRLSVPSVAELAVNGGTDLAQRRQLRTVKVQQDQFLGQAKALDPNLKVLGEVHRVFNAVMLEIDAASLPALAANPAVLSINPVVDYQLDLSETVPYIGATAVQNMGFTGKGVRVAVLDTGVDYTHADLGGPGTVEAWEAAYGPGGDPDAINNKVITNTYDGKLLYPTAKVIGGYDFVGEDWPTYGDLAPDPNPIDSAGGHGTHVADILGGLSGVAPGVGIYALKVCSSVTTGCSGVALIEAMDWAVDPNGDGRVNDHVDVINMSLGSLYGQSFDDDLSQMVDIASGVGVLTVAASGNDSDKPFVTSTPAAAFTALSVAQTEVPSAFQPLMEVVSPAAIAGQYAAVFQPWSAPLTDIVEAPLQYADGAGGNLDGCAPFATGSLTGKIVLVDRGACNFTLKIKNIGEGGGLIGLIGLVAPGDPFEGGDGGDRPITIPGYMISQADSNTLKSGLSMGEVTIKFDPNVGIPLVMHMVGTSSRGPGNQGTIIRPEGNIIKPEIGAPGASISAVAGTGDESAPFGGTSGATPMVAGSAALLMQAYPNHNPLEIKAALVNNGFTDIMNKPAFFGGDLAPITRIGGGEVRVDRAVTSPAIAWDTLNHTPELSFGFQDITQPVTTLKKFVTVRNFSNQAITYKLSSTFRFQNDVDNGAVQVTVLPDQITVPASHGLLAGQKSFVVVLTIDGAKLRLWGLNSGSQGANGNTLTTFEYDGYIWLDNLATSDDDAKMLHVPWQVLPRQSDNVQANPTTVTLDQVAYDLPAGTSTLTNTGIGTARIDAYSLIGTSPELTPGGWGQQSPVIDLKNVGVATYPVPAGYCSDVDSFVMSFAVNTWERQVHANAPAEFEFDLDVDQDGSADYAVLNRDLTFTGLSDGRNVTWVYNVATGSADAFFYTDQGTNTANTVLTICGEQIGMNATNFGQFMNMNVYAVDNYFTGNVTDYIEGIQIAPMGERYLGLVNDIPYGASDTLTVLDFGPTGTNPGEMGVLLMLDGARTGFKGGAPLHNEAIPIFVQQP